jgi:peptidyl-prolyl cis-trans isomerase SurA
MLSLVFLSSLRDGVCQQKEYDGIVAVVNDEVITNEDLEERIRWALFTLGKDDSPSLRMQISSAVVWEMIMEKLRCGRTKKFAPKGGWVSPKEVEDTLTNLAEANKLSLKTFEELLGKKRIRKSTVSEMIRANLAWEAYLETRYGRYINISESDVKRTLAQVKERGKQELYYVHRMFFPVSDERNEREVSGQVNNLMQMLNRGVSFSSLARQFSRGPAASKGGELGWVLQGQLSQEEDRELHRMAVGSNAVVRNNRGYAILLLQDRKESGGTSYTTLQLVQVVIPVQDDNLPREAVQMLFDSAKTLKNDAQNANDLVRKAQESGFCAVSPPVQAILEEISPEIRPLVANLSAGGISNPCKMPNGIVMFGILDRKTNEIPLPTAEKVLRQKQNERLSVFSDQEVQDLKKIADIQYNKKYERLDKVSGKDFG